MFRIEQQDVLGWHTGRCRAPIDTLIESPSAGRFDDQVTRRLEYGVKRMLSSFVENGLEPDRLAIRRVVGGDDEEPLGQIFRYGFQLIQQR